MNLESAKETILSIPDNTVRVWDLQTGECLAVYHAGAEVNSAVVSPVGGRMVCGTDDGQVHFLTPVNFPPSGPAILTALNTKQARCPCCATGCEPHADVLAAILPSSEFPYPSQAFADPRLLTTCPHCAKPLKFNPFFVAASKSRKTWWKFW